MPRIKLIILTVIISIIFSQTLHADTVGIIAAMPEEIASLSSQKIIIGQHIKAKIKGHNVVMALSGIGKVNAALTAQILISEYKAKAIIFTGVAGAVNKDYEIGDVVIAEKTFQHDYGYLDQQKLVNHRPGTLPELRLGDASEPIYFQTNNIANWERIIKSLKALEAKFNTINGYKPKLKIGTIATGDQFIANDARKEELVKLRADAVEMEGASVAQVATVNKIPCIIIRSISDKANHDSGVDFPAFLKAAAANNASIVGSILELLQLTGQ
jgi:adenosylhomocysteine nucleosidase